MKTRFQKPLFFAKLLLFGEYGIIGNSKGLSIPFDQFQGRLKFKPIDSDKAKRSNSHLYGFFAFLRRLKDTNKEMAAFDLSRFEKDLKAGLHFESNIPEGFGVGSSGALCAAIYHRYAREPIREYQKGEGIAELKRIFAQMEDYFHGKSSGIDPLICYLNIPILIKSKTHLETVGIPIQDLQGKAAIFLLNSGSPGETEPMVSLFMDKLKKEGFRNMMKAQFKKYNDACIEAFLNRDAKPFFQNLKSLSTLVFKHFKPMIPQGYQKLWQKGIDSNAYYLKLCGSGGGGYVLGFTPDVAQAQALLGKEAMEVIYKF